LVILALFTEDFLSAFGLVGADDEATAFLVRRRSAVGVSDINVRFSQALGDTREGAGFIVNLDDQNILLHHIKLFLFEKQDSSYKQQVLPKGVRTVSVEAGTSFGWAKYSHAQVSIDTFGVSGPAPALFEEFGFTVPNVVKVALELFNA
jgi:hypothetical protein